MGRLGSGTRKRADGMLEKRFTVDGKRYSVYGKNTKEIEQKEHETRKMIDAGIYTSNRKITLDQYFEEWLTGKRNSTWGEGRRSRCSYLGGYRLQGKCDPCNQNSHV